MEGPGIGAAKALRTTSCLKGVMMRRLVPELKHCSMVSEREALGRGVRAPSVVAAGGVSGKAFRRMAQKASSAAGGMLLRIALPLL